MEIDALQHATATVGNGDRRLPRLLSGLSAALRTRADLRGNMADLDAAVDAARRAADLLVGDAPDLFTVLTLLVTALNDRFARTEDPADLDEIIDAARRLVAHERDPSARAPVLHGLGIMLNRRFARTGNSIDVDAAINAYREAVESVPAGHQDEARYLGSLFAVLWTRFESTTNRTDLDEFIEVGRMLADATRDDPDRLVTLHNLGMGLSARHWLAGDPADLDEAISVGQQALAAAADDYPGLAVLLCKVSEYQVDRFRWSGEPTDADAAIATARRAAAVAGRGDPRLPEALVNLSNALRSKYSWSGDLADLDEAVNAARQAVAAAPADHRERPRCANTLASALLGLYQRTGDRANLDEALAAARQATESTPAGFGNRPNFLHTLGSILSERFALTGDRDSLDAAIDALREAVAAADGRMDQVSYLASSLASSLSRRFRETGELADLHHAVDAARRALAATRPDDPLRPRILDRLGVVLLSRFDRAGDRGDLDAAIGALGEAAAIIPANHPDHASSLHNLACALQARYERSDDPADLRKTIELGLQAVTGAVTDRDRALFLSNLAIRRQALFERTGDLAEVDAAVEALRAAVACAPADYVNRPIYLSNLSGALDKRFARTRDRADADAAVEAARAAVDVTTKDSPSRYAHLHSLGMSLARRFWSLGGPTDRDEAVSAFVSGAAAQVSPPLVRILSARAGAALTADSDPAKAAWLLATAVELLPEVAPRSLARDDQQHLIGESADLAGDAAALALSDPSVPEADRPSRALSLLEAGRAILLGQALEIRTDLTELRARQPRLAERFTRLRGQLDQYADAGRPVTMGPDADVGPSPEARRELADRFAALMREIRTQPGFERFALPPTESQLRAQAEDGPVVTVNVSEYRCDALVLTAGGVTGVPLPGLGQEELAERTTSFQRALLTAADPASEDTITEILAWLWDTVAEPVLRSLGHHRAPTEGVPWPRVWWIPTGRLTSLPLHAAGYHADSYGPGRTVMDRVISSYTPTISALRHARRKSRPPTEPGRSLIVSMPTTPGAPALAGVRAEATAIAGIVPRPLTLEGADGVGASERSATRQHVEAALPECTFAHFACHARSDPVNPARSLLLLHDHEDHPFNVARVATLDLGRASLAYLSACETALATTTTLLDEAIQLVAAFQLAGFPHVIGTLWPINDKVAVTVATAFYACLRTADGTLDASAAAQALHLATRAARRVHRRSPSLWAAYLHSGA